MLHFFNLRRRRRSKSGALVTWAPDPEIRIWRRAATAVSYLLIIVLIHSFSMMLFEKMSFGDSIWLTMTSVTTVGYGDLSAASWQGRLATVLFIYLGGIFIVGKFAGDFFDYRAARRTAMKSGNWDYSNFEDHIVVVGSEQDYEYYFSRLADELSKHEQTQNRGVLLISQSFPDGLPISLENMGIKYVNGAGTEPQALYRAGVEHAHIVIVMSWNSNEARSDSSTFDIIHRIREANQQAQVVAECVDDNNRKRLLGAGATVVVRPLRSYPEMIVGSLLNPGSSEILENLFTSEGERIECLDCDENRTWDQIVIEYVSADKGIPIAFRRKSDSTIITAPAAKDQIEANAVFVLGRAAT